MRLSDYLRRIYWACEKRIVPGLRFSQYHYRDWLLRELTGDTDWLDIGCGHQLFADWMRPDQQQAYARCRTAFGIDLDWPGLQNHPDLRNKVFGSAYELPFADGSFHLVTANMVVEHIEDPPRLLGEVRRVLRPGGLFAFHTPNRRGYRTVAARLVRNQKLKNLLARLLEGRSEEDVFPAFYRLNQVEAIHRQARQAGFGIHHLQTQETNAIFQLILPLAIGELLLIRLLQREAAWPYRATLLAVLHKPIATP